MSALIGGALTVALSLLFLRAAWHKAQAFAETTGFVAGYGLVPPGREAPVLRALIAAEGATVLLLALPATRPLGGLGAAALLLGYAAAMALALRAGRARIECGCGGAPQVVSPALVGRNLLLAAAGVAVALLPGQPMGGAPGAAAAIAAGVTLWCLHGTAERLFANAGHIRLAQDQR
ncbi:MauE/DoxX family redox-associated membrane protein [Rubellimicrobium aerolatum]|uniref:Methylamine utilization protein MauE n=1 Tax=Rubellimicrobium aerolatum TaxID=490979 RepID=A0ABW0SAH2_9RHOB|nr:MauE/DoxX family redox-associated membrane protein [Rubellimicrobium aerolatum]MBP1805253.1 hypothetical protein [Rubellimicrobium aerolatum]